MWKKDGKISRANKTKETVWPSVYLPSGYFYRSGDRKHGNSFKQYEEMQLFNLSDQLAGSVYAKLILLFERDG